MSASLGRTYELSILRRVQRQPAAWRVCMMLSLHVLWQVLARQLPFLDRTAMMMRVCSQGAGDAKNGGKEAPAEDLALLAAAGLRRCVCRCKAQIGRLNPGRPSSAPCIQDRRHGHAETCPRVL